MAIGPGEISAVFASIRAAGDIASSMIGLSNAESVRGKVAEIQAKLLEAQDAAFRANETRNMLQGRIQELEQAVAALDEWRAEEGRYRLVNAGLQGRGDVFVYALVESQAKGEPPHFACPRCFKEHKVSVLQATQRLDMRLRVHSCPACKTEYSFRQVPVIAEASIISSDFDPFRDA